MVGSRRCLASLLALLLLSLLLGRFVASQVAVPLHRINRRRRRRRRHGARPSRQSAALLPIVPRRWNGSGERLSHHPAAVVLVNDILDV